MATLSGSVEKTSAEFFNESSNVEHIYTGKFDTSVGVVLGLRSPKDDYLHIRFSNGVSLIYGIVPLIPPESAVILGTGTWSSRGKDGRWSPPFELPTVTRGYGKIVATSATSFVASVMINDVRHKYSATFEPPISTFESDSIVINFTTEGQIIGKTAFSGYIGIRDLDLRLSSPGVTISGPLSRNTTSRLQIFGTGTWDESSVGPQKARGTLSTTSSSTLVAKFMVDDAAHTYRAKFHPPLPSFGADDATLIFDNLEVGVNSIQLMLSSSGVEMNGDLNRHMNQKYTISGTGVWDSASPDPEPPVGPVAEPKRPMRVEKKVLLYSVTRTWAD
ncbi:hypothetical protein BD779DRAFT_1516222 [Infundibulicybe gibba]|nr:hypothetical protein BD779DRAFT_1516222 [Infundibulicybe gibba]